VLVRFSPTVSIGSLSSSDFDRSLTEASFGPIFPSAGPALEIMDLALMIEESLKA
jgi:hypothetical protein